jgi:hypothetical protein
MTLKNEYDVIFYVDTVGTVVEDNGVRTTDNEYRHNINQEILKLLELYPPKKLVVLTGPTSDRVNTVLSTIF